MLKAFLSKAKEKSQYKSSQPFYWMQRDATGSFAMGVTYRYGAKEELLETGVGVIADSPEEVLVQCKGKSFGPLERM